MAATVDGNFVVISPNLALIWKIPQESIYLRADRCYGPHDPTLLPQPYIRKYPYLGAIPSKPMDKTDPLSMLWWNPTPGDFLSSNGGVVNGIGKLRMVRHDFLLDMRKRLEEKYVYIAPITTNTAPSTISSCYSKEICTTPLPVSAPCT